MNRYRYRVEKIGIDIIDGDIYEWSEPLKDIFYTKDEAERFCKEYNIENYRIRKVRLNYHYYCKYSLNKKYEYTLYKVGLCGNASLSNGTKLTDYLNQHKEIYVDISSFEKLRKEEVISRANKMVKDYINKLRKESNENENTNS